MFSNFFLNPTQKVHMQTFCTLSGGNAYDFNNIHFFLLLSWSLTKTTYFSVLLSNTLMSNTPVHNLATLCLLLSLLSRKVGWFRIDKKRVRLGNKLLLQKIALNNKDKLQNCFFCIKIVINCQEKTDWLGLDNKMRLVGYQINKVDD